MAIIKLDNKAVNDILSYDLNVLKLKLSTIKNKNLFDSFKKNFTILDDYKPLNDTEKYHILDFSAIYINELMFRMTNASNNGLIELAKIIQTEMKTCYKDNYHTRNLVRLYSEAIDLMNARKIDKKLIKKEFL